MKPLLPPRAQVAGRRSTAEGSPRRARPSRRAAAAGSSAVLVDLGAPFLGAELREQDHVADRARVR